MKNLLFAVISCSVLSCNANTSNIQLPEQKPVQENEISLEVSPYIDQEFEINQKLIRTLSEFFKTKKDSLTENEYWLPSDFKEFIVPFQDISSPYYGGGKYDEDRKSTRLNSSHVRISYAVFCLKKKKKKNNKI